MIPKRKQLKEGYTDSLEGSINSLIGKWFRHSASVNGNSFLIENSFTSSDDEELYFVINFKGIRNNYPLKDIVHFISSGLWIQKKEN